MNKWLYGLLCCCLFSCQTKQASYTIAGTVSGNDYENEVVYLVPLEGATVENVDSTYIRDGEFRFSGKIDTPSIYIIRTRPIVRLKLEEVLVVVEPGEIQVKLESTSSTAGTILNNALQEWKERKSSYELKRNHLSSLLNQTDKPEIIKNEISTIDSDFSKYNYSFVKENKKNIVGSFVFKMTRALLSSEQIVDLEEL
ncbi:DUF4369 domain-containing protein [Massilibacteroides vaginae]|uniref:DUF4369 domain-containing protein n=1 Tax=Massilibacteroides vaginae TaxID=1673718 RepID=UPI000A1CC636|nr:DUF4369 domain-containing protein [Massilibacteroides vaginae]